MNPISQEKIWILAAALLKLIVAEFQIEPSELRQRLHDAKRKLIEGFYREIWADPTGFHPGYIEFFAEDFVRAYDPRWRHRWEQETVPKIAEFLDQMSDLWSKHGCSNYDLAAIFPDVEDRRAIAWEHHQINGDPEEFDPESEYNYYYDWILMWFCAERLKQAQTTN